MPPTGLSLAQQDLGVIHRGHLQQGRSLVAHYLLQGGAGGGGSPYSEGAILYSLVSIHVNNGDDIFDEIKNALYTDMAVCSEAASIVMGLLMVGTQQRRGLALGIALTVYGREEEADTLIEQMTRD